MHNFIRGHLSQMRLVYGKSALHAMSVSLTEIYFHRINSVLFYGHFKCGQTQDIGDSNGEFSLCGDIMLVGVII